jgi:hypothetical protein
MARPTRARAGLLLLLALAAILGLGLFGSAAAAAPVIYDTFAQALDAQAPNGYMTAKKLVDALGLRPSYSNPSLVATLLVPNDAAFAALAEGSGVTPDGLLQMAQTNPLLKRMLTNALSFNQIPGVAIGQFQFQDGQKVKTAYQGKELAVKRDASGVYLSGGLNSRESPAKIVNGNIRTKTGVAHGVNAALVPFTLPRTLGGK